MKNKVYSTEFGKMCPKCNKPINNCVCKRQKSIAKSDGFIRLGRETKGRKGKGVTIVSGVPVSNSDELINFAKKLKQKLGTGGTVKNGVIEIQGDHRASLIIELEKQGFKVKCSGG